MKLRLAACVAAVCSLPAYGDKTTLPPSVVDALSPIDTVPTRSALDGAFADSQGALDSLRVIALDRSGDLGIQLRAIRALPSYCPAAPKSCGVDSPVHDALVSLVKTITAEAPALQSPQDLLRLRAAVEALGQTRTGLYSDVETLMPLLGSGSRDLRATTARALLNVCNTQALGGLSKSYSTEPVPQVRVELSAAIQDLRDCGN